jgi:pyruvate,water dikinase
VVRALRNWEEALEVCDVPEHEPVETGLTLKARQLVGQPAGAGIAFGKARVVLDSSDLFNFKSGEILVCDAVDPNMTFVVPLAAGIVERRGGMLIHGAIIAREYGIPCVTGVADAANLIRTGDRVTVDGHLGIVIIGEPSLKDADAA